MPEWHRAPRNSLQTVGFVQSVVDRSIKLHDVGVPTTTIVRSIARMSQGVIGPKTEVWVLLKELLQMIWRV